MYWCGMYRCIDVVFIVAEDEGRGDEPSRIDTLLSATQIENFCSQIDKYTGTGFNKLFLQKEST